MRKVKPLNDFIFKIEVQLTNQGNMEKRTIFYLSKLYTSGIKQGEDYSKLPRVITINLLDFEILGTKGDHSSFHFWEDEEKDYMLTDVAEIHFLEYPKFRRLNEKNYKDNAIERWLAFLEKDILEDTLKELVDMEPAIKKAESKLYLKQAKKLFIKYFYPDAMEF